MAETPTMEVRARLTAETAQFTRSMQQATQSVDSFSNNSARLRGTMLGIGVAAGAAGAAIIAFSTKAFMAAARVDELDVSMNAVGKATGLGYQAIRDAAQATKDMGIEMAIAQQSAIKFAQNNLDLAYASKLARAAQDLAVVSGKNSTETFNMLTHAVITGRSEVLKSVGIQKSAGQMYESFARSIGVSASALTYQQKQLAVATGALAEAERVAGAYEAAMDSPGKVLRSFARLHNEIQVSVGGVLLKAFGPMIKSLYDFEKYISKAFEKGKLFKVYLDALGMVLVKLAEPVTDLLDKLKYFAEGFTTSGRSVDEARQIYARVLPTIDSIAAKFEMLLPVIASAGAGFATFAGRDLLRNLPILGNVLQGLRVFPVVMVTLALTSTQVRNALINLITAFKPLLPVILQLGKIASQASVIGIAILAKAINMLAGAVRSSFSFIQQYANAFKVLLGVLAVLIVMYGAYRAQVLILNAITAVQRTLTEALTTATTAYSIAQSKLNTIMSMNPIGVYIALIVGLITVFVYLMATNEDFAKVVGKVFNFALRTIIIFAASVLQGISAIIKGIAHLINVFNFLPKIIAAIVVGIVVTFGSIIGVVADLLGAFNSLLRGASIIFTKMLDSVKQLGVGFFGVFEKIALGIGTFLGSAFDAITGWVRSLANLLGFIPGVTSTVNKALDSVRSGITALPNKIVGFGENAFNGIISGAKEAINKVGTLGQSIENGLRSTEKRLINFDLDVVGNFADSVRDKTFALGDSLIAFSKVMLEYADTTDFSSIVGTGISDLLGKIKSSLKEGLGFGDILAEEKKKYSEVSKTGDDATKTAEDALKAADRMKTIRDAMQAGIDSIKGVLDDLRNASADFADSLKDTITGFAGLKSIELPDGFIPKAKSLIENMRQRLDKSNQFAQQIATLQARGLDSGALKDIIESGPVKGAQLAASILGGGAEAIAQINSLQKAISFSGAAIGQYGADAAFGGLIGNAETQLARLTEADLSTRTRGNNQFIEQGAFQVVVNTSGAKNTEEEIKMITDKIQQTFAILAKELAAK